MEARNARHGVPQVASATYSLDVLGSIPTDTGDCYGGIAEDAAGNVYLSNGDSHLLSQAAIYRKAPGQPSNAPAAWRRRIRK